jgi:hypothetical protein
MAEIRDVPGQAIETQACVVYDKRTGAVVHTHTFVPAEPGSREEPSALVKAALEAVGDHADREHLVAKMVPPSAFTPGASYRVDPESEAIELEEPGVDPAAMERRGGTSE